VHAAAQLGMEGYVHWDWLGDWGKPLTVGAGVRSFLDEVSKASAKAGWGNFAAMVATVPDVIKPSHIPPLVGPGARELWQLCSRDRTAMIGRRVSCQLKPDVSL
jgi:hypothetical protein